MDNHFVVIVKIIRNSFKFFIGMRRIPWLLLIKASIKDIHLAWHLVTHERTHLLVTGCQIAAYVCIGVWSLSQTLSFAPNERGHCVSS